MLRTIVFEDHAQDYLEWDIGIAGNVIDCRPCKTELWVGCQLITDVDDLEAGEYVHLFDKNGKRTVMRYPIVEVLTSIDKPGQ